MKRSLILVALGSSCLTLVAVWSFGMATATPKVKLENSRVKVTEMVYTPGARRERYTRPADQVIVFLDDCKYERTDSKTHKKTIQERKAGDVIFHHKGEDGPLLVSLSQNRYRELVIELK